MGWGGAGRGGVGRGGAKVRVKVRDGARNVILILDLV